MITNYLYKTNIYIHISKFKNLTGPCKVEVLCTSETGKGEIRVTNYLNQKNYSLLERMTMIDHWKEF